MTIVLAWWWIVPLVMLFVSCILAALCESWGFLGSAILIIGLMLFERWLP